ncbi:MAG: hypothetical protein L3J96_08120, partial [Thermoplasmata archaeon]|nr:hypothetical protein [Thermoplasmata archaeon]
NGWGWTEPRVLGLLATAVIVAIVFVVWEFRSTNPLVPVRLFSRRVMSAGGGATFFIGMIFFPLATFLSLVVGVVLSHGASNAADIVRDILYALVIPVVFGAVVGGQLLTRVPYRVVAVLGILTALVGIADLTQLSTSTPLWKFAFVVIPVGGVVLPLIPMGFGIGLTFPVFLLAAQNQVSTEDVGEAGGLIQFLQSLGGAIGLSVLASFQQTRFTALDPSPTAACTSSAPPFPQCAGFLSSYQSSLIAAYDQTFTVMLALLVVALVFAVFLTGRLPKAAPKLPGP